MIKSFLILILIFALGAGAALSRPDEKSFETYYRAQAQETSKGNLLSNLFGGLSVDNFISSCTYHNCIFWADIEQNGQTVYVGAFNHWWAKNPSATGPAKK